jgi:hypothetical protein
MAAMPSLMLRGVPGPLMKRLRQYARENDLTPLGAALLALEAGLTALDARRRGGQTLNAQLTPEERSANARRAAEARWSKVLLQPTPAPPKLAATVEGPGHGACHYCRTRSAVHAATLTEAATGTVVATKVQLCDACLKLVPPA